ncbi:MAG: trypsin-like peptidase domain-containing protein [Actinobacteria bacterium]|nr:trypsin-like peptidase domain-containing protein [Actinomycetota bacterium]
MRRLLAPLAILAALTVACSVSLGGSSSTAGKASTVDLSSNGGEEPIVNVVKAVLPAVVNVTTDQFRPDPFGGSQQGQGVGTGFIVRADGVIVTNCHVVEGASKITVSLNGQDNGNGAQYPARLIGSDCLHDLAVLKVDATNLPTVAIGSSSALQLGQRVVAIGYALDLTGGPTVTTGIVSSLDRTIRAQDPGCDPQVCQGGARTYAGVIQIDAAINPGNSGGPLVNLHGQVVGINTAGTQNAENIGFAIPIDDAKDTILSAEDHPLAPSAYLGVITQSVTSDVAFRFGLAVSSGAYVVATPPDGPAAAAGISEGDVIVEVNGNAITSADDLGKVLGTLSPGQRVPVKVVRQGGGTVTLEIRLGARPLPTQLP